MKFWICICLTVIILFLETGDTLAGNLLDRIRDFPQWYSQPQLNQARSDLVYPEWMAGDWQVSSTLVEQIAPLAPDIVTPGFKANESYLDKEIQFQVRFERKYLPIQIGSPLPSLITGNLPVVADRAFNGLQIARTYLGKDAVHSVKVDPNNPNRQITFLQGNSLLISTVTARGSETPQQNQFIGTEITQQVFRHDPQIYINQVETTSSYTLLDEGTIEAEQITAIYLSPQDPDYFIAAGRPVALYRYKLKLYPLQPFLL